MSEGAEKTESTITERSSSDKSFDYHEASGDSDSVQDLELGAHSHKRHAMISLLPSQKKPAMDPRGVYSSLAARDELKPDVAHQLVDEEYLKRSIACTESSSECAICLCTYGKCVSFTAIAWNSTRYLRSNANTILPVIFYLCCQILMSR